jgi:hypothetical protein
VDKRRTSAFNFLITFCPFSATMMVKIVTAGSFLDLRALTYSTFFSKLTPSFWNDFSITATASASSLDKMLSEREHNVT